MPEFAAFISYRQLPPDREIARRLHQLLEDYRIPKGLANGGAARRIGRVFLDNAELAASSSLNKSLRDALKSSRFLVIICSPRVRASPWIREEVRIFTKANGSDRILLVLAEGQLPEAAPEQLASEESPLAVDVRAPKLRQTLRCLEREKLRLLAPIIGCAYDDLKQRNRERDARDRLRIVLALAAVLFVVVVLAGISWDSRSRAEETEAIRRSSLAAASFVGGAYADAEQHDLMRALEHVAKAVELSDASDPRRPVYLSKFLNLALAGIEPVTQIRVDFTEARLDRSGEIAALNPVRAPPHLWSLRESKVLPRPLLDDAYERTKASAVAISGDGSLAVVESAGSVFLWRHADRAYLRWADADPVEHFGFVPAFVPRHGLEITRDNRYVLLVDPHPRIVYGWLRIEPSSKALKLELADPPRQGFESASDGATVFLDCASASLEVHDFDPRPQIEDHTCLLPPPLRVLDKRALLTLSTGLVRVFEESGRFREFQLAAEPEAWAQGLVQSSDGTQIIGASRSGQVHFFSAETGELTREPIRVPVPIIGGPLAFAHNRIAIISAGGYVHRFKIPPYLMSVTTKLGGPISFAAFSPSGRQALVLTSSTTELALVDLESGKKTWSRRLALSDPSLFRATFDNSGTRIALSAGQYVELLESTTGQPTFKFAPPSNIEALSFSRDGNHLITVWAERARREAAVVFWTLEAKTGASGKRCWLKDFDFDEAHFMQDGEMVFFEKGGLLFMMVKVDGCTTLAARGTGLMHNRLRSAEHADPMSSDPVGWSRVAADVSQAGRWMLTRSFSRELSLRTKEVFRVWDLETGAPLTAPLPRTGVLTAAFTEDEREVLLIDRTGGIEKIRIAVSSVSKPEWLERATRILAERPIDDDSRDRTIAERERSLTELAPHLNQASKNGDERATWLLELLAWRAR